MLFPTSWKQALARPSQTLCDVLINCLAGLLRELETDRPASLPLANRGALHRVTMRSDVFHPQIAPPQLAVDR